MADVVTVIHPRLTAVMATIINTTQAMDVQVTTVTCGRVMTVQVAMVP